MPEANQSTKPLSIPAASAEPTRPFITPLEPGAIEQPNDPTEYNPALARAHGDTRAMPNPNPNQGLGTQGQINPPGQGRTGVDYLPSDPNLYPAGHVEAQQQGLPSKPLPQHVTGADGVTVVDEAAHDASLDAPADTRDRSERARDTIQEMLSHVQQNHLGADVVIALRTALVRTLQALLTLLPPKQPPV